MYFQLHEYHYLSSVSLRQYRACVVDFLGLGFTCILYHCTTSHPDLVSFDFYAIPIFRILVLGADYGSQSVSLTFVRGSILQCHNVSILQDDDCEQPPEDFFADLAYASGIQPININIPTTEVIINDSSEQECGKCNVPTRITVTHRANYRAFLRGTCWHYCS